MTRLLGSLGIVGVLLTGPFAGHATTGQASEPSNALEPSPDVEVHIQVTGKAIYRDGSGPAEPSGTSPLGIPESPSYQFSAGEIGEQGCSMAMSMSVGSNLTPPDPAPPVWWVVRAQMVSKQLAGATIDFAWQRRLNSPFVAGPALVERTRRLTLVEGRPHILDYVPVESDGTNCDAILIQAEVQFVDPPSVAGAELEYDVWLVETGADRREHTRRVLQTGAQAESLAYRFPDSAFAADGRRTDDGPLTMNVSGTVKGRVRTDGRIDLIFHAAQGIGTARAGRTTWAGNQILIVSPGEVVEIPLPPVTGTVAGFDLGKVFAGQRTALRVVARRAW